MRRNASLMLATLTLVAVSEMLAAQQTGTPPAQQPPATATAQGGQPAPGAARRPRPYNQVITDRAHTERGGVTVHKVDDRWFLEVPDSLLRRDILLVSRVAGVPAGFGGFQFSGQEIARR